MRWRRMLHVNETKTSSHMKNSISTEELTRLAKLCFSKGVGRAEFILSFEHKLRLSAASAWFHAIERSSSQ